MQLTVGFSDEIRLDGQLSNSRLKADFNLLGPG